MDAFVLCIILDCSGYIFIWKSLEIWDKMVSQHHFLVKHGNQMGWWQLRSFRWDGTNERSNLSHVIIKIPPFFVNLKGDICLWMKYLPSSKKLNNKYNQSINQSAVLYCILIDYMIDWLIVLHPVQELSDNLRAAKFRLICLTPYCLWTGRDAYHVTTAVTKWDLGFRSLIQRSLS
mgnify:CR=1 FL=1